LREFLRYLADQPTFVSPSTGYAFIILYGIVYIGLAVSSAIYWRLVYKTLVQMRGCLVSAVYDKTVLEIDPSKGDMEAPVSLVSTDMERIISGAKDLHEIWANSLQAALTIWLLYKELGLACVAPAVVAIVSSLGSMLMSPHADKAQVAWMEATQERIGATARAVAGMRAVKLLGLSDAVYSLLDKLRTAELHAARHFRYIEVLTAVIAFMPLFLSPVFTFLIFVVQAKATGERLDTVKAFVSLSLLQLMTQPLVWLFQAVPMLVASLGCINRVDEYLRSPGKTKSSVPRESNDGSSPHGDAISIRGGEFGWTLEPEKAVLSDVNITIPAQRLTLVVGPVASGKSTLAKALVGQLPHIVGDFHSCHSGDGIAFCDQEPFLMNGTIRANIVGFSNTDSVDSQWLDTVIRAVALDQDLSTFPDGIDTVVGSKGTRLSGGQRQRVSIARALYSRKQMAVLDDVLSSLDAATTEHVFDNVLGPRGLLREMSCTIVLCTHEVSLMPRADHIIVLGRDGKVADTGTYEDLIKTSAYVQSLVIGSGSRTTSDISDAERDAIHAEFDCSSQGVEGKEVAFVQTVDEEPSLSSDEPQDDLTRRLGDASIYKYLVRHFSLWRTVVFVILTCGSAVFSTIGPVWLSFWSSDNGLAIHDDDYYLGIYALFQTMALVFLGLFCGFALTTMAVKAGKSLHQVLLHAAIWAPMTFFSTTDTGIITNRFSGDIILIDGDLAMSLLETLSAGLVAVVQMIYIGVAGPYVAISYPFLLVCLYFVQSFYLKTSRQLRFLDLEARSPLQTRLLETIQGLATIRSFGWGQPSVQKFQGVVDASQQPLYLLYMVQRWLQLVLELLIAATAIMLVAVALQLRSTSQGFLGVALIQLMSLSQELKMTVINYTNLETSLTAVSRIKSFEEKTPSENSRGNDRMFEEPPEGWPLTGRVTFDSVSVSYSTPSGKVTDSDKDNSTLALQNFTIDIPAGQKVAIVGRSGSGKSTLLSALASMVDLYSGSIHIDGLDSSSFTPSVVRSRALNIIPQEPFFFHKTVALNLDPDGTHSDEQIRDALEKVQLSDVVEFMGGLHAKIDLDTQLSQGQKQLLALARALLKSDANIVLLDEATSR